MTVIGLPNLGLSKANPSSQTVGVAGSYSFTISNTGTDVSGTTLNVFEQLPANLAFNSGTGVSGGTVTPSGVTCTVVSGTVASGQLLNCAVSLPSGLTAGTGTANFNLSVTPQAGVASSVINQAQIDPSGANAAQTPSTCTATGSPAGCAVTASQSVDTGVSLGLSKANPPSLVVGSSSSYQLTLSNTGVNHSATSLVFYDQLPANFQYDGAGPLTSGSVTPTGVSCISSGQTSSGLLLTCTVTLPAGGVPATTGTAALSISVTPLAGAAGVSASNRAAIDPSGLNAAQTPSSCTANNVPNAGCAVAAAMSPIAPATAGQSQLNIAPAGPLVAGLASYTVTATARDSAGNVVSAMSNTFSFSASGGSLSATSCSTATSGGSAGSCSVTFSSSVAASYSLSATLGGSAISGSPGPAVFVAGTATAAQSRVSISSGPKTANGSDAYTLTATAYDANGNLASGASTSFSFSFSAPGSGAALSASSCTTTSGTCSVTLTATVAGSYAITASLGGTSVGGTNPVTGVFVAGAATAAASRVSISSGPKTANGSDAYTLTATAYDANGNLVTGSSNTFSFSAPGTGAALSASTCTTTAGTCSVTLTATVAGSYAITASLGGTSVGGTNPVTGVFVAGAATAAASRVAISSGPKTANGSDAYTLTATAYDANGNLASGASTTFSFSAPGTGGSLSASSCTTTSGTCSVTLTATVAGSYAITASLGGTAVGGSNPVTGVFVAGAATAAASRVSISSGPKTANGSDAYTLTATAYDADGNLVTGSGNTFSFSAPGTGAALSASTCTTTSGTCSVTLTATVAGSYSVTASLGGTSVGGTNPVTGVFVAGAATAAASRVTISSGPKTANGSDAYTLTASAYDANGNLASGASTSFSFSAPGTGASLSASTCVTTAGTCSVTLTATVAGSYAITASLGGTSVGGTNPVTGVFVAGAATAAASRVSISSGPKTANGSDAYTLTATAYDANGNLASGVSTSFSFSAPGAGAALSASSCTTTSGTCSVTLTATVAGSYSVTASLGGTSVGGTNPVTGVFVAGAATAAASRVSISSGPKTANGSDAYTLTATAYDANGNLVTGSSNTFSFSAPGNGAALSASSCATTSGTCSVTLTATVAGSYAITASLGGTALGGTNPVTGVFVAGAATAAASRVAISSGPRTANGSDAYTLTASAYDANGNLVTGSGTTFSFSAPGSGAVLSASTCTTTAGICSVTLTATVAGSYDITASLGGTSVGGTNPVTGVFVAGAATAAASRVSISSGPKTANGSDAYTLTATAYDANGNLVTGSSNTFSFSAPGTGASLSASTCVTTAGTCSVTLTATVAGSYAITASLGGTSVGGTNPVTGVFVAGAVTAAASRVSISSGPKTANGSDAYTLTASAYDANGNLASGASTSFSFSAPGTGASLSASTCVTTAGTCSVTLTATVAGSYAITASLGGTSVGGANPVTGVFVAGAATAAASRVAISSGPKTANGSDAYTLTATAYDANGNLVTGSSNTFSFSAPGNGAALSATSCTTLSGTCSVTLTATVAGSYAITASLSGTAVGGTNPVTGVFVAGSASAAASRVGISSGPLTANGVAAYSLTASAYDANGNLVTGSSQSFSFSAPGTGASLSASSCTTTTGSCSVSLTATVAGSYAITASLGGMAVGGTNPVTGVFVAGTPVASASRLAIDTGPKIANGADAYTVTATAYDAQGNLNGSNAVTFSFDALQPASGASLSAGSCTTATTGPDAGRCSVNLRATVAGAYSLGARLDGSLIGGNNPASAVFVAGPPTASASRIDISAGPRMANGSDSYTLTVSAFDAAGNLSGAAATTFDFSAPATGASLSALSCSTATSGAQAGTCSVTLSATVAGSYAITASLGGTALGGSNPVSGVFVAGTPTASSARVAISTGPKTADGVAAYTLTASATDANGNLNTASALTISFSAPAAGASLSALSCTTATTGSDAGTCAVTLTATVAGSYPITASLGGTPLGGSNPVTGVFVAGPVSAAGSRLSLDPPGPLTADGVATYTLTVRAQDAYGNLNAGSAQDFVFSTPGAGASLSASHCSTATSGPQAGTCSVTLRATLATTYALSASLGGVAVGGSPVSAVFVAGEAGAATARARIDAGPRLANGSDAYTLTASASDAFGNLDSSRVYTFSFSPPAAGASLSASSCDTATSGLSAGTCTVSLSATLAGSYAISVSLGGTALGGTNPLSASFVAGPSTAATARIRISDAGPRVANGADAYTLTASALDANGNLNSSAALNVSFSAPGAGASLSAASCTTATSGAEAGTCSVGLSATVAGSYSVGASTGGTPLGGANPVTGVFVAGAVVAGSSSLSIDSGPKTANGSDAYTLSVTARDANGNLVSGGSSSFNFSVGGTGATLSASSCNTSAGRCSVTLSATVAGSYTVTANLAGQAIGGSNPANAVFVAGPVTAASSRITISPDGPKAANGSDAYNITASAYDAQGNLVTGVPSTFVFSPPGAGASLSASSCTTSSGHCTVQITATVVGTYTVGATLGGTPVGGTNPVSASFQAGVATAAQSQALISSGPQLANGLDAYTVSAVAYDALGNPVTLNPVTFTFALESLPSAATLGAASCVTPTTGPEAGRCGVSLVAGAAASYRVEVRLDGTGLASPVANSPVTGVFVAGSAAAGHSLFRISSGPKTANGSDAYTLTASAYDGNGNLVTGSSNTFSFSAPGAGATLSASTCTTTSGTCSVTLMATVAGSYSVTASLGGTAVGGTNPVTGVFVAGAATAAASRVAISSGPKTANGSDAYTLTATAYDANGNLVTGSSNTFNFSAPGTGASLSANSCNTTAGTCSVTLTATVAGSYAITASLGGTSVGGTNPVTGVFVAGAATAAASRVAISSGPKTANGSDAYTLTATAYDANGNLVTGSSTSFSFSAPGAGGALSASTCTTTAGTCSVTLTATVAGSYSVTASLGGTAVGGTNPVTGVFVAGAATAAASRVAISSGPKTANGSDAYTLTTTAYDTNGNLVTGSSTSFSFSAPGSGAALSASTCTTTSGTCSVTLTATVAGSYAITASLGGTAVGGSNPVTGVFAAGSAAGASSSVSISAGPHTADGVSAYTITVAARDALGNLNTASSTDFSFSVSGSGARLGSAACSTATTGAAAGTCSVSLTATVAGSYTVSARSAGVLVGQGNPVTALFVAGLPDAAASRVSISAGPRLADGSDSHVITVTAYDAQGNLSVANAASFEFSAPGAGAWLGAGSCVTEIAGAAAGNCSVRLSATVAGSYAVTASLGGTALGGDNPVSGVFVANGADAGRSSVRIDLTGGARYANGADSYTITVTALDANGNPNRTQVQTFDFALQGVAARGLAVSELGVRALAGASLSASQCSTAISGAQAGTCSVRLSSTLAGWATVRASLAGTPLGQPASGEVSGQFLPGPVSAAGSSLSIDAGPRRADGREFYTLTATARDAFGNLNTAVATEFSFVPPRAGASLGALTCRTALTGAAAGTCSVTLRATLAGLYPVVAQLGAWRLVCPSTAWSMPSSRPRRRAR